jgi:adenine-specific DNA-methyltransferase
MEQRKIAPIWSAVFGRGDLKFVFNEAGVRNLTNFHCIYPKSNDTVHQRALTLCLNSDTSRASSKLHGRVYGGGLNKFEPNDLKAIQVPDLRQVPRDTLVEMANLLSLLNTTPNDLSLHEAADAICNEAGAAASRT